jgi:hypothetical protein
MERETSVSGVIDDRGLATVSVDHSTLKGEPSGTDTRYSVSLVGPIDQVWTEAFRILQADSTMFRRLRLDAPARQVTFTCRAIEGPTLVFEILERLDALIKRVNRQTLGRRT